MTLEKQGQFKKELESLINRYSAELGSDTPDFILAEVMFSSMCLFDEATNKRDNYYGYDPSGDNKLNN